ncbi:MAG: cytochrome c oxidase subunit 3 [Alphaproteobacteria bacterium]|nr:MAG: cytochrome c oxidase subunit 3 [Alphaproteobacteria bacterium]
MADTHSDQNHPYHMVAPSPWPVLGAGAALVLAGGAIVFMHDGGPWIMLAGVAALLYVMFRWWADVIREAEDGHSHNPIVRIGLRYGMALFIVSEVMFFFGFFWAFFGASLFPAGGVWPPQGVEVLEPFDWPLLNTFILLASGATLTWAHHGLIEDDRRDLVQGLAATITLGITFTAIQAYEYSHAAFGFTEGIYPTTFYMATGFHGFHVIIGTIFLTVCLVRAVKGHFKPDHHVGFEAAAWYWHFVDVVWLFLFFSIYWWGS